MKTIWVELQSISAIILILVSIALRVFYGRRWLEWENSLVESWGINPLAYTLVKVGALLFLGGYWVWRERRKRRKRNALAYELPNS